MRSIDFVNHTIVANNAGRNIVLGELGGGIALALLSSGIEIANNIIAFNSSGIWNHPNPLGTATLTANDVFSNGTSNYIGLTAGPTDISADPQFVKYSEGDLHLTSTSPCLDGGSNNAVPIALTTDISGQPRIMDGNTDGNAVVDMGAVEFPGAPAPTFTPTRTPTRPPTSAPTPTRTVAASATGTATRTATHTPSGTTTPTHLPTAAPTPTNTTPATVSPTQTAGLPLSASPTATATSTPAPSTATPAPTTTEIVCVGDCNSDGTVTIEELITGVGIALEIVPLGECSAFDANGDEQVMVDELLQGVNNALNSCPDAAAARTAIVFASSG